MRKIQLILAVAGLVSTSALNAQTKPKTEKDAKVFKPSEEECTSKDGMTTCNIFRFREDSSLIKRAAIGVQIQTTGTKRDTIGVFIARVVPNGPAEKAGIVEGERIVSVNGVDLRVPAADVEDSYTAGLASHRLSREIEKLTPGAVVRLQVNSGGRTREVQVTTVRASEIRKIEGFGMFEGTPFPPDMPGMPNIRILRENMGQLRMLRPGGAIVTPRVAPSRVRIISPSAAPTRYQIEDDMVFEGPAKPPAPALVPAPAFAPLPTVPAKPKALGAFITSI
jgi:hypothetical protein